MFPHICAQGLCIWPWQGQGHGGRCGEGGIQTHVGAGVSGGPGGSRLASGTPGPSCRIGPGCRGAQPLSHPEPALASISCAGHLPAPGGGGADDPFLPLAPHDPGGALWRQCPAARQEASAPGLAPSAGPHPQLPPPRHPTVQAAPTASGNCKGMRLQGLGVTLGRVEDLRNPVSPLPTLTSG